MLGSRQVGKARLTLLAHYAKREQGAPKLALVPSESARVELERSILALDSEFPLGGAGNDLRISTRLISATTDIDDPELELGAMSPHIETPGERLEQEWEGTHYLGNTIALRHMWTLGVERLRRYERQNNVDVQALAAKRLSARIAGSVEWRPIESLVFDALAAAQCYDTSEDTLNVCANFAPTGRASARFERSTWEVYANAGRYVRLPTLSELHGVGILVRGNPSLAEEKGTTMGAGARVQAPRPGGKPYFWADAAGFARYSEDLVTYIRTAQGYLHPVNRNRSRTLGAEISAGSHPTPPLLLETNVSFLDPRDTSPDRVTTNDVLPFLSRATLSARIEYEWDTGRTRDLSKVIAGTRGYFQSSRYADPAGLGVIPAQTFVDLELGAVLYHEIFHLRSRVSNIFNAERFDVVGFPLPGRSVYFSLEARL
jgi:iron complex outermembrane receptor protein